MENEAKVIQWAKDKGIFKESTPLLQAFKAKEEIAELIFELNEYHMDKVEGRRYVAAMELGDVLVCLTNVAAMLGLNLEICLEMAYKKIQKRTGRMKDGMWVKNEGS